MRPIIVFAAALALAACSTTPPRFAGPDPADPTAAVPPTRYAATLGAYTPERPVAPRSWREQNQGVAPKPRGEGTR